MPENWKTYKIGKITSEVFSGGTPSTKKEEYYGGNIPWLNTKEVDFRNIRSTEKFITELGLQKSSAKWVPKNAIIIAMYGNTAGKSAIAKIPLTTNQACCNLVINPKQADYRFVYYRVLNDYKLIKDLSVGGAQQNLNAGNIKNYEIKLPPLQEQKIIASILSALDDKIELNLQMNKTLEKMAVALYKHWFVDFGPFQDGEFVDSELGEIPKGWEVKSIGELYNTTSGGTPSRKKPEYYEEGTINWVKSKELYGDFIIDTEEKINNLGLKKSSAKLIPPKSVLLAMYGATVGESSILSIEATCNQAICAILEKELSFIYVFLYLRIFKTDILNQATGSAQQNISQQIIKNISIISPPVGLQVFKELEDYYNLIEQNVFENKSLTQLRDTLLPKLISGEVRVKDVEKTLSEVL